MNRTEEYIYYNELFDLYGALLNEREQEIFSLFYEEDLSLQEIADHRGVSKSAIGSAIKTINQKLETYEKKINALKQKKELQDIILEIKDKEIQNKLTKIINKEI